MSFVRSVHNPKIMLGMLVKVLCSNSIPTRRRLPREGIVAFEDLMRGASDFDARTTTFEILTSVRYRFPMTVEIVTVITTIRSAGLSCSHETFGIDDEVGSQSQSQSVSEYPRSDGVAPLFCTAPALSSQHASWGRRYFQHLFGAMPRRDHWSRRRLRVVRPRTWSRSDPKAIVVRMPYASPIG